MPRGEYRTRLVLITLPFLIYLVLILRYEKMFLVLNRSKSSVVFRKFILHSFSVEKSLECSKTLSSCVINLTEKSKILRTMNMLQCIGAMLMVLSLDFRGKLNSTVTGVMYLSLIFFTSVKGIYVGSG